MPTVFRVSVPNVPWNYNNVWSSECDHGNQWRIKVSSKFDELINLKCSRYYHVFCNFFEKRWLPDNAMIFGAIKSIRRNWLRCRRLKSSLLNQFLAIQAVTHAVECIQLCERRSLDKPISITALYWLLSKQTTTPFQSFKMSRFTNGTMCICGT